MRAPRTFKSDPQTDPAKAMKIPKPTARFPAARALLLLLLLAVATPCDSTASVQATVQWIANASEIVQPDVIQTQLRENMGSVYVAASLPADSAVLASVNVPVEQVYIVPPPTTPPPPTPPPPPPTQPPPPGGGGSGGIKTTTSAPRPPPQDSSSSVTEAGGANSAVLAASLAVGGVGLIGVAVWAFARKGPKQLQPPPYSPPVIPEKIVRPTAPPMPPPPPQFYPPPQPQPPPYTPAAAPPVPQPVTYVPQLVYYTPQQPPPQPVIPVNIDRTGPTYRVFART